MRLCLGTAQLGMKYGVASKSNISKREAMQIMDFAIKKGIKVFDTAAGYGEAEHLLGQFIRENQLESGEIKIITKLRGDLLENVDCSEYEQAIYSETTKSLQRVGISKFEGVLFHNPDLVFNEKAMSSLRSIKTMDLCRKIGLSLYTLEQAEKAISYEFLDIIQLPYNILDRRFDESIFAKAKNLGIEIHIRSVLLQGLLVMSLNDLPQYLENARPILIKYKKICNENNSSPLSAALLFAKMNQKIDSIVFGVDSQIQLDEFLRIFSSEEMNLELYRKLLQEFKDIPVEIINPNLWRSL